MCFSPNLSPGDIDSRTGLSKTYVQMPHYRGGNLRMWLQEKAADAPPQRRVQLLTGLLGAVQYIHTAKIWHNDIKLSNMLLNDQCTEAVRWACNRGAGNFLGAGEIVHMGCGTLTAGTGPAVGSSHSVCFQD